MKLNDKITKALSNNLFEITIITILAFILVTIGTFFPNDYAKRKIETSLLDKIKHIGFFQPTITNSSPKEFISSLRKCVDYINLDLTKKEHIDFSIIAAQAVIESDYGTSRFAIEGNNLFGIREWSRQGILPNSYKESLSWRIKVFSTKCNSVKYYIDNINLSHHYKDFRDARTNNHSVIKQVEHLSVYATNKSYVNKIKETIKYLKDKKYI